MARLYIAGVAVLAALIGALVIYQWGYGSARDDAARQAAQDYQEGREDADDATDDLPADDAGLRGWLLRFGSD